MHWVRGGRDICAPTVSGTERIRSSSFTSGASVNLYVNVRVRRTIAVPSTLMSA